MSPISLYAYFCFTFLVIGSDVPIVSPAAASHAYEERKQELIASRFDSLFTVFAEKEGFNGNVLLSQHGKVVYERALGYADLSRKTPLNIESVFQLASVSKQFTSVAMMILHDQGKLEFGDPVWKYFPDFPYKNVTIRHLLRHRSGIPDYMTFAGKFWKTRDEFLTNQDLMRMLVRRHPRLEFAPDKRYKYSNTGYAVLASIVEKISGQPYAEFLRRHVFLPLGMHNTFVYNPDTVQPVTFKTTGYNNDCEPAHEDYLSGVVGDKGIYTTVDDMFKWDQALYTESLVKQSTLEEAFTPLSYDDKRHSNYGYGWRIKVLEDGSKIVYHAGWWRGYNSLYVRRLEDKTSIIVLSNKVNWSFRNIGNMFRLIDSTSVNADVLTDD